MNSDAYVLGLICTAIISLCSLSGVIILPLIRGRSRARWMQVFVALAVATLSADALLHLIPATMGAHSHSIEKEHGHHDKLTGSNITELTAAAATLDGSHEGHDHNHEHDHEHDHASHEDHDHAVDGDHDHVHGNDTDQADHDHDHDHAHNHTDHDHEHKRLKRDAHKDHDHEHEHGHEGHGHDKSYLLKMSAMMLAVYVFYIFEFVTHWGLSKNRTKSVHPTSNGVPNGTASWQGKTDDVIVRVKSSSSDGHGHSHGGVGQDTEVCCGFKSIALMILVGDGVHNFVDGLAVGASFAVSNSLGFSTSIAVVFHEIPHEIGDFAVLIDSGLSVPKALIMNLISACTAFLGLIVGIEAGQNEELVPWLLAVAAGMFLYVAWIDMLNHLKTEVDASDPWYLTLSLQNAGFIVGFVIIFLIGWFEDDLQFTF